MFCEAKKVCQKVKVESHHRNHWLAERKTFARYFPISREFLCIFIWFSIWFIKPHSVHSKSSSSLNDAARLFKGKIHKQDLYKLNKQSQKNIWMQVHLALSLSAEKENTCRKFCKRSARLKRSTWSPWMYLLLLETYVLPDLPFNSFRCNCIWWGKLYPSLFIRFRRNFPGKFVFRLSIIGSHVSKKDIPYRRV